MDPDGVLGWIEEKIAAATLVPRENGEVRVARLLLLRCGGGNEALGRFT